MGNLSLTADNTVLTCTYDLCNVLLPNVCVNVDIKGYGSIPVNVYQWIHIYVYTHIHTFTYIYLGVCVFFLRIIYIIYVCIRVR